MKKKILIISGIVLVALIGIMGYLASATKKHSPAATASIQINDLKMEVKYCRPYRKNRLIFGDEKNSALQPYGKYWRAGANEATTFNVNKDIVFNDQPVKAGIYSLYAIPGETKWIIALNKDYDRWGASPPDEEDDVIRTEVTANNTASDMDQFIISFDPADSSSSSTHLVLHWDHTQVKIPVKAK